MGCPRLQVLINGKPRTAHSFLRKAAYVPQSDSFVPTMTTRETLSFYASLILPPGMSPADRHHRISEVLRVLGLHNHADTLVSD